MLQKLYKTTNPSLLWEIRENTAGYDYVYSEPFCSNDSCRVPLDQAYLGTNKTGQYISGWLCSNCKKEYECPGNDYQSFVQSIQKKYEGFIRQRHEIISLDLIPTKVAAGAEDEHFWLRARILEKNGKRQAVIFIGEKIKGKQEKTDYAQLFLDLEDEQVRFDKNNKNPMGLLCRLTAEFENSSTALSKKGN